MFAHVKLYTNITNLIDADKLKELLKKCDDYCKSLEEENQEILSRALDFCGENNFSGVQEGNFQKYFSKPLREVVDLAKQTQLNQDEVKDLSKQLRNYIKESKEEILRKKVR